MMYFTKSIYLFLTALVLFCSCPTAFADETALADETPIQLQEEYDWQHTSALYRGWGWGLFGTGLALQAIGLGLALGNPGEFNDYDDKYTLNTGSVYGGGSMALIGGASVITGIGLLIADAVKFKPYRDHENDSTPVVIDPEDWEHTSALYRGWGWGLFGTGVAAFGTGIALLLVNVNCNCSCRDYTWPGVIVSTAGAAAIITGSSLLIADAVKFNPYRRGEVANGFSFQPEFYLSPQMTGLGLSGRF